MQGEILAYSMIALLSSHIEANGKLSLNGEDEFSHTLKRRESLVSEWLLDVLSTVACSLLANRVDRHNRAKSCL
jgi:hypothetical protein